jgi:hypothetical protein
MMQCIAQIGIGARFSGIGPKAEGNLLPRLRCIGVQHEIGQQRLLAGLVKSTKQLAVQGHAKIAQKANV